MAMSPDSPPAARGADHTSWVAFLRGINVGGHRVTGPELAAIFVDLGFAEVHTFLASGNIVFDAPDRPDPTAIADGLEAALGYGVPTILRSAAAVRELASTSPFNNSDLAGRGKPQVLFLANPLDGITRSELQSMSTDADRLVVGEDEIEWLPTGGILDADLDLDRIAALTGTATMRTRNTVERLARKYLL